MKIIAVTGGIGSGKSTVSGILRELGAVVLDSDRLAHEVRDTAAREEVVATFGREILTAQGTIDRKRLAEVVFKDPAALKKLNGIIHPKLEAEIQRRLDALAKKGTQAVVIEIPLIEEAEWPARADQIWVIKTPRQLALQRLEARGLSQSEARARMDNQTPAETHVKTRLVVIENDGNLAALRTKVENLWEQFHNKKRRQRRHSAHGENS